MIKDGKFLIADEGKVLVFKNNRYPSLVLGTQYLYINKKVDLYTIKEEDVKECYPVNIYDNTYYISSIEYEDIVTELIRKKYSLDQELALLANLRNDPEKYHNDDLEFQKWRSLCKQAAKKIVNE